MPRSWRSFPRRRHQRNTCWVVLDRESTTTGTPSSRLRMDLRKRSRKLEKLDTHATKAGARHTSTSPAASASASASPRARSTWLASTASTISVTPSCLPKSIAWLATRPAACGPSASSKSASAARTATRRSRARAAKVCTCSMTRSTSLAVASMIAPFSRPKASTVAFRVPPVSASPRSNVTAGSLIHEAGSCASMRAIVLARSLVA
mmetsp:Transcript_13222/g.44824  ORF Transcript_13222/g.44824 Transcript_13222/m.44824 type:complete len:207 (-) Transcript_13222:145-765(-)